MYGRFASLVLLCGACVCGQSAPSGARELTLSKTDGTYHLRNQYNSAATAWIVECHGETDPGKEWSSRWKWSDSEVGMAGKPLAQGAETEFRIQPPMRMPNMKQPETAGKCDNFTVAAAVFADGTVTGGLKWIHAILTERQAIYKDVDRATEILKKAGDRDAAVHELSEWWKSEDARRAERTPTAGNGDSTGSQWAKIAEGRRNFAVHSPRPLQRGTVPEAALWLIEEKKAELPDAIRTLAEWRERLGELQAVAGPDVASAAFPRFGTGRQAPPDLIGKPAPEFTLKDVDGHDVALKDLRGKIVLLNFWATWCAPCREEMPKLKALYDDFKDRGLVVVTVDINEPSETARKYFTENGYAFRNLVDSGDAFAKYGGGGVPKVVLIDRDGIVREYEQGYRGQDFRSEVAKLGLK